MAFLRASFHTWLLPWSLVLAFCGAGFAVNNPVPFIDLPTVPTSITPGGADFTLTVNGAGFVNGAVVNWNGNPRATTFVSGAQVTATILSSDIATAGTAEITVANPAPGGGTSNTAFFEVTSPVSSVVVAGIQLLNLNFGGFFAPIAVDLNHDGKLDLILHRQLPDGVHPYVALGNGDGTFQTPVEIQNALVENAPVVLADFNHDGNLDAALVTCCDVPSTISLLLGNGDGTFRAPMFFGSQANTVYRNVVVGDFNQDGNLDIVTNYYVGTNAGNALLLGNGDGTLQAPIDTPHSPQCVATQAADLNVDGKLDLFGSFGTNGPSTFFAQLGNGDGTFQPCVQTTGGFFLAQTSLADVNGDEIPDILAFFEDIEPSFYSVGSEVVLGNGDGTFTGSGASIDGFPAFPPADLNGDGKLDFVVAAGVRFPPADDLSFVPGNGDGTFGNQVAIQTFTGVSLYPLTQGDFNGDGTQDVLASDSSGNLWMFLQGSFPVSSVFPSSLTFSQPVGTTSTGQAVTLFNTGNASLMLSAANVSGTNADDFQQTNNCPASLAAGASCQITVAFTPGALGDRVGVLNIPNNGLGANSVPLSGIGTDFSVTAPTPPSVTVAPGQTANYSFELEPIDGFTGTITLRCDGAPAGAKCNVPPSAMVNASKNTPVHVTVSTTASQVAKTQIHVANRWLACFFGIPLLLCAAGTGNIRRHLRIILLTLCMVGVSLLMGCGGGGNGSSVGGTPAGSYPLTVTASITIGGVTLPHQTTMTLVVK